jgi:hypothetical protein
MNNCVLYRIDNFDQLCSHLIGTNCDKLLDFIVNSIFLIFFFFFFVNK